MKKRLVISASVVVAVAAGLVGVVKLRQRKPESIEVQTEMVAPRTVVQSVTATGRIQPTAQVNISADVSGKITRMAVKEGAWVEKGELLLELDRERYVAAVEVTEAAVRSATSNAELARENMVKAQKDLERSIGLAENNLVSQASRDAAYATAQAEKARHKSTLDQVAEARAQLKQRVDDLSKTTIFAPISGTVSKLNKEAGEIALGSQFQEDVILVLSNLTGMEALVDVDENDIVSVAVGDLATIEIDALPGVQLKGTVTDIASSAKLTGSGTTDQKTEFEVKVAVLDDNSALRPGMTATSDIVTETRDNTLAVPIQCVAVRTPEQVQQPAEAHGTSDKSVVAAAGGPALEPDKDGFVQLVFVIEAGHARARQVKTGIQSETHIEVLEGLEAGVEVVVGNYRAISKDLRHDSPVLVKNADVPEKAVVAQR